MVDDELLTKETYQVLQKVPANWWNYNEVVDGIARALSRSPTKVRGSLAHLMSRHLVERRRRNTIAPSVEIRKIGL